jgi:cell shape-determining protein MreC
MQRWLPTVALYGAAALLPWLLAPLVRLVVWSDDSPQPRGVDAATADRIAALTTENLALRRQLAAQQAFAAAGLDEWLRVTTRILRRSRRIGNELYIIDHGTVHGVRNGMAAVDGTTLLGIVAAKQPDAAVVRLCRDQDFRLPVLILPPEGEQRQPTQGVLHGGKEPEVTLVPVREGEHIGPGQIIVTAAGAHRPAGLRVGTVLEAEPRWDQPAWQIRARWAAESDPVGSMVILVDQPPLAAAGAVPSAKPPTLPEQTNGG